MMMDGTEGLTMVIVCRKGVRDWWWMEDLGETGTIGIGARAGSFYMRKDFYHLSFIGQESPSA
jgi:hypothetical protein